MFGMAMCIFIFSNKDFFFSVTEGKKAGPFMLFSFCSHQVLSCIYLNVNYQTDKLNRSKIFLEVYRNADKYLVQTESSMTLCSGILRLSSAG